MKRKRWMIPAIIFLLTIAGTVVVYVCPQQELRGSLIFFGLLGFILISGVLLVVPLCLLLVKYLTKRP